MATTNQRPIIDIHSKKKKESNVTLKRVIKSQDKRTKTKGARYTKQHQNNEQNGNEKTHYQ